MKSNIHAGHDAQGKGASGASSYIDGIGWIHESVEDRNVKDEVIRLLKEENNITYDCTVDSAGTQDKNLYQIVAKCNAHNVDLDVSIHFNSGRDDEDGDGDNAGVEVYCYDEKTKDIAERICKNISKLGFDNRGVKIKKDYYVLRKTKAPAILIECCFIDDKDDVLLYKKVGYKAIAKAIVEGILNEKIDNKQNSNTSQGSSTNKFKNGDYTGKKARVTANVLNVRWDRGTNFDIIGKLKKNDIVKLNYCINGWISIEGYKGNKGLGYIHTDYIELL
ncbi:N-acetylmuramoyl-L-alanine amidase [Romboutsia sp. MSSM.1001216sp_RTP31141st1_G3_RTP31141_220114]|uniref:N-acetylmuramoyl-L-alanine amidase n=1 Tax=unclassified Romboutsia TaxID=2626894 RepID=UPI0031B6434B